ncbi:hypothetical protein BH23CHL2_BH23CHL2_30010 [soil metagenome]
MNTSPDNELLAAQLLDGRMHPDDFSDLDDRRRNDIIDLLIEQPGGRRWLRASPLLNTELAGRLIEYDDDFQGQRRDTTLEPVIALAGLDELVAHSPAIAAGSGAPALWSRLSKHPDHFRGAIRSVISKGDSRAIDATATHLLLDPANPYRLNPDQQAQIALKMLSTDTETGRGVAAEFLATNAPDELSDQLDALVRDRSAAVRGFAWFAAFRVDREAATDRAIELLGDESIAAKMRQSALNATGEALPTEQIVELLSYFVVHPSEALALDAANLLQRHHRHPEIAIAAAGSPHEAVREIANRLMDPYRGSPAAGGSRPGDPLRSDPLLELMRQLEDDETGK